MLPEQWSAIDHSATSPERAIVPAGACRRPSGLSLRDNFTKTVGQMLIAYSGRTMQSPFADWVNIQNEPTMFALRQHQRAPIRPPRLGGGYVPVPFAVS